VTSTPALRPLLATEVTLHRRHGVLVATAVLTSVWVAVLTVLPAPVRVAVVPWVLLVDLATLGFFFVPALAVVERSNGVTAALRLTRLSPATALSVRLGTLAASALLAGTAVVVAAGLGWAPDILAGVALTSLLVSLVAVLMVGRATTLTVYVSRVPAVAIPLIAPAVVRGSGLWDGALLALSPMTGAFDLLAGRWSWTTALWICVWLAGLWLAAVRVGFDTRAADQSVLARPNRSTLRASSGYSRRSAIRSFARVDRRTLLDDRLLLLLLAGVPLIAGAVRWFNGPGLAWVHTRYGLDLTEHLPLVWAFLVVVHIPTMFGAVTGLLFLEDRDAGLLPAITTTRPSLPVLVAYRLATTALITGAMVVIALQLARAHHPLGTAGTIATSLAAAAVSTVPAMLLATLAHDRVQGMALMKVISLPLYLPLAWWFIDHPAGWLLAAVPTAWAARTFWADTTGRLLGSASSAIGMSVALTAVLAWKLRRSTIT
jgi:fluoroquinolone transport system permease protein